MVSMRIPVSASTLDRWIRFANERKKHLDLFRERSLVDDDILFDHFCDSWVV